MDNNERMRRKQEIVLTTNSRGWPLVVRMMENTVVAAERAAIDEDDDTRGAQLRRNAKAAREFLQNFLRAIESARQTDTDFDGTEEADADPWYEPVMG